MSENSSSDKIKELETIIATYRSHPYHYLTKEGKIISARELEEQRNVAYELCADLLTMLHYRAQSEEEVIVVVKSFKEKYPSAFENNPHFSTLPHNLKALLEEL